MEKQLTLRQSAFLQKYLDPSAPVFGNAGRAYQEVYGCSDGAARSDACRLLKKPSFQAAVADRLLKNEVVLDRVVSSIAQVMKGEFTHKTLSQRFDKSGAHEGTTATQSTPTAGEVLKAIELLLRIAKSFN